MNHMKRISYVFIFLFLITTVSGAEWDNSVDYSNGDKTITVTNLFGLGGTIGKGDLKTPLKDNMVLVGKNRIVMVYDFYDFDNYKNGLGEVVFIDMETKKIIDKEYHFEQITYDTYTAPNWGRTCTIAKNGTEVCSMYITHYQTVERMVRTPYDSKVLDKSITLALVTDVEEGDSIDGKWQIAGKYADRHAVWNATKDLENIHYWKFDESVPESKAVDELGTNNITVILGNFSDGGILNNMLNVSGVGQMNGSSQNNAEITGNQNRTLNFWSFTNGVTVPGTSGVAGWGGTGAKEGFYVLIISGTFQYFDVTNTIDSGIGLTPSWLMHTITSNGTGSSYYINGTLMGSISGSTLATTATPFFIGRRLEIGAADWFNATIDEMAVWNRTLSTSEIVDLYNDGFALPFQVGDVSVTVDLDSPANSTSTHISTQFFSSDFQLFGPGNLTNATLQVWLSNGTLFTTNSTDVTGISNSTNLSITTSVQQGLSWNYLVCGINLTNVDLCFMAAVNRTIDFGYTLNAETFTTPVGDLSNDTFILNITLHSDVSFSSATLRYDDSNFSTTKSSDGSNNLFNRILDIPSVISSSIRNFTWIINLDGTEFETNQQQQTVTPSTFAQCNNTFTTTVVNFTTYDEDSGESINVTDFDATFEWSLALNGETKNLSVGLANNHSFQFCIEPNATFFVDSTIRLQSSGHDERTYIFSQESYDNTTRTETKLFLLNSSRASDIIIEVKDTGLQPLEGFTIQIFRQNPDTGVETLVEQDETDIFGQIVASLIERDIKYRFKFFDTSNTLVKTTGLITIACRSTICVVPFIIEDTTDDFERFDNITSFDFGLTFNNNTNIFTYSWTDNTGDVVDNYRLNVQRRLLNGTTTVCNVTSTSSSSSLTCDVGSQRASYQAQAFRKESGEEEVRILVISSTVGKQHDTFGFEGLFWSFILLFTLMIVGIFSPTVGIILYVVGLIFIGFTDIVYISPALIIAQILIGGLFVWAFKS